MSINGKSLRGHRLIIGLSMLGMGIKPKLKSTVNKAYLGFYVIGISLRGHRFIIAKDRFQVINKKKRN